MNQSLRTLVALGCIVVVTLWLLPTAQGADLKARMKARAPQILGLKAKGVIGETHAGYLAFVGGNREGADIVKAENTDRKAVYTAIAKKTGAPVAQVGARAALKRKANLGKGEYFKNADGKWSRK